MYLKSINPSNGEVINTFDEIHSDEISQIIEQSTVTFLLWKNVALESRLKPIKELSNLLRGNKDRLASIISNEMGKPIEQSKGEVEKCAWLCDYYYENSKNFLQQRNIDTEARESFVSFQPLGPILGIMPWNFPFWQVFRFAIPTICVGNVVIVKHASNVPACSIAIEQLFIEAGFPNHVYQNVLITNNKVESIISNKKIKGVALTGSTPVGKEVARQAASHLKKVVLELGGSDPYIVLKDVDISLAVDACVTGRLINTGQSCIAAKRFIIEEDIYEEFSKLFVDKMSEIKMGDPFIADNQIGPMARMNLREDLHIQVTKSINMGADLLCGGEMPDGEGYFYPATVLGNVTDAMPAFHEELFGPVACLIKVKDENEAVQVANHTNFGLGSAIFTNDIEKGKRIAEYELEAGCCFVNDYVRSDPRLPFGGIKESGYGRELSEFGMFEFCNIKSIWIK
ncbi:MAG: NAD-dependent succinate-semialdehyde dehydrogenase [Marinilabiliaceae bacterium]|nr:NAD-dependent succinate-semialdehyde dehydrogenase [Marinilabiliaceae bacterium]